MRADNLYVCELVPAAYYYNNAGLRTSSAGCAPRASTGWLAGADTLIVQHGSGRCIFMQAVRQL
jgi:hypothetical protein